MEDYQKRIIAGIIYFIIFSAIIYAARDSIPFEDSIKKVDCFDRDWNKIEGLTCEEEIHGINGFERSVIFAFFIILSIIFSIWGSFMIFPKDIIY